MTDTALTRRILKPRDCVFALALPTVRREFDADCGRHDKELARVYGIWERYRQEVAAPADRLLPQMSDLGATVIRRVTLRRFGQLFHRDFAVIILMAHWRKSGAIELADGFAEVGEIIEAIPRNAGRILDLGACQPWPLTLAVRRERPGCVVRMTDSDATPAIWLNFYALILHRLLAQRATYLEAVEMTIRELRKRTHGRKH